MTLNSQLDVTPVAKIAACKALINHELTQIAESLANVETAAIELARAAAEARIKL